MGDNGGAGSYVARQVRRDGLHASTYMHMCVHVHVCIDREQHGCAGLPEDWRQHGGVGVGGELLQQRAERGCMASNQLSFISDVELLVLFLSLANLAIAADNLHVRHEVTGEYRL